MSLSPQQIAQCLENFDSISIPHPRLTRLTDEASYLEAETFSRIIQNEKRQNRAGQRPIKLDELWLLPVIGPSGSGKSFAIKKIVDTAYDTAGDDDIPILPVTLRSSTRSPRQLQQQILEAFNDPTANILLLNQRHYSEAHVNEAIRKIARKRKTGIVVLDEAHNLLGSSHSGTANLMAKAFRSLVNDGIFSLILAGTNEMLPLLRADSELLSRQREAVVMNRLTLDEEDCRYFLNFVSRFELDLVEKKVIDRKIGLTANADACATVYEFAQGVIGVVVRVLRLAVQRGLRKPDPSVDWSDVGVAFRNWAASQDNSKATRFDPFDNGPRKVTETAMTEAISRKAA